METRRTIAEKELKKTTTPRKKYIREDIVFA
jgi:hypothetical protein